MLACEGLAHYVYQRNMSAKPSHTSDQHKELRKALIDLDLTMADVAAVAGCSSMFVSYVVREKRNADSPMGRRVRYVVDNLIRKRHLPSSDEIPVAAV